MPGTTPPGQALGGKQHSLYSHKLGHETEADSSLLCRSSQAPPAWRTEAPRHRRQTAFLLASLSSALLIKDYTLQKSSVLALLGNHCHVPWRGTNRGGHTRKAKASLDVTDVEGFRAMQASQHRGPSPGPFMHAPCTAGQAPVYLPTVLSERPGMQPQLRLSRLQQLWRQAPYPA